jgi:hypothetical protein
MYVAVYPAMGAPQLLHPSTDAAAFFQADYHASVDYTASSEDMPNNNYAVTAHPSELVAAVDSQPDTTVAFGTEVYAHDPYLFEDSLTEVASGSSGDENGSGGVEALYRSTPTKGIRNYVEDAATGHFFGKATCEVFNICDPTTQLPGSVCMSPNGDKGFCFEAEGPHELMCGRLIDINDEYGQTPIYLDLPSGPYRCPRWSPVLAMGEVTVDRLLIGGCMETAATNYDSMAEIHAEAMCEYDVASPAKSIVEGCMFPGAENHVPGALAPGKCLWLTEGCIDSTALNYNSDATTDDGSCILPKYGCTLGNALVGGDGVSHAYSGTTIDPATPKYESLYFGSALRSIGVVDMPDYKAAVNFDADATVNEGCIIAVEGCMDSTAANYYSLATINSQSWCIPVTEGCMMPSASSSSAGTFSTTSLHEKQGLATNFDTAATVHDVDLCTVKYVGCMDSSAINYDSLATVSGDEGPSGNGCWYAKAGCLDDAAYNYGCQTPGVTSCLSSTGDQASVNRLTVHVPAICSFTYPNPPPPPSPAVPPGVSVSNKYETKIEFIVDVWDATIQSTIETSIASQFGIDQSKVTATGTLRAASGRRLSDAEYDVELLIESDTEAAQETMTSNVASQLGDLESAEAVLGIEIASVPTVTSETTTTILMPPSAPPPPNVETVLTTSDGSSGLGAGALAGIIVGALLGVGIVVGVVVFMMMKQKKKKQAATVEPAY